MRIIICGAGQVGYQIARRLASENNDVAILDVSAELVSKAADALDIRGVAGHAAHPDTLERAGARDADMLIAATYSDEVNMVACQIAHSIFEVPRKIARVRAQEYLKPQWSDIFRRDHMPIDVVISPEIEVAGVVIRRLAAPAAFDSTPFLDGKVEAVGAKVSQECPVANTPMRQLAQLFPDLRARVVAFVRDGHLRSAAPEDQLFPGDEAYIVVDTRHVRRALELFGQASDAAGRVVLVGAGNIGVQVAVQLEKTDTRSKLVEADRSRAEKAAEQLERTIVLHGDGLSAEVLSEANVQDAHAVVSLTQDDKVNVLCAALAKQMGCQRALALTNDPSLAPLAGPLGIDAFVNPRATTVSTILRHVRRGRIRALHTLRDGEGELFEAQVLATSPIAGKRVRELELPSGATIGAVLSNGQVATPDADTMIEAGDTVVMFSIKRDLKQVEALFRVGLEFF
ncbi:MAG: Trk system potassium transporter TrkA [Neomegalonema sp.]|nr:Trk system potassium transporter TrkA [Neomegalonema sp.]